MLTTGMVFSKHSFTCDCGCGASVENFFTPPDWIELREPRKKGKIPVWTKFASRECLLRWLIARGVKANRKEKL